MSNKNAILKKTFQSLYGHPCWGLQSSKWINLSLRFGKPSLSIREPRPSKSKFETVRQLAASRQVTVRGEWLLWIYCSFWKLSLDQTKLAASSSSNRVIEQGMARLDGQKLTSVEILPLTGATKFVFDLGCTLECRRFSKDSNKELWTLYKPSGYVLSVFGDGTFCHQRATEKNEKRHIEIK